MKIEVKCDECGDTFMKEKSTIKAIKFCSRECKNNYFTGKPNENISKSLKGRFLGDKNPNFGNKWSDDQKKHLSDLKKSQVDDTYRNNCSKGMKGKTISDESKEKRAKTLIEKYGRLSNTTGHTESIKIIIGQKSKDKFTPEFKIQQYKTMVDRGIWLSKENKDPYKYYRELSNWGNNLELFDDSDWDKINKIGFFHYKNNRSGLVRDHRYSRMSGFKNDVFPEILRHPVNCELITHSNNVKKQQNKNISSDSITLIELFELIICYEKHYINQIECVDLIDKYKNGKRYNKSNYIERHT